MARKKKTEEELTFEQKYLQLVDACKSMVSKYKLGHTITCNEDYRYPGLKEVVEALDTLSE